MRKYLKFAFLLALAGLIFWWAGRGLDWTAVRRDLQSADVRLLGAAVAFVCLTYVIRAYRWRVLLAPVAESGMGALFAATTMGFGAVFLVGRAGEIVRPIVLPMRDHRVRPAASFVTILVERIYDMVAVVVLFAVNLLWFRPRAETGVNFAHVQEAGVALLLVSIIGVGCLVWLRLNSTRALRWLTWLLSGRRVLPGRLTRLILGVVEHLASALRVLVDLRELAVTVAWTALLWFAIALANFLVLRAFALQLGIMDAVFVLGWALVGSLVPTPGGAAGAFHAATAAGLVFLGVAIERAAAISIILHLVVFAPALVFGTYYALRGNISIRRLVRLAEEKDVEHAVEDAVSEAPDKGMGGGLSASAAE